MRLDPDGPARGRQGHPGQVRRRALQDPGDLHRRHLPRQRLRRARRSASRRKRYMDAGEYVPDEVTNLMVRNRIDEPDAEPGFLLDGYPRTLAQVEELDGMIGFTGHRLDAVVVLTVDDDELVQRLLQRAADRGPRRRHRGRHPAPPGGLRRADRAAHRGLPRPRPPHRGRRHGRGRRRHERIFAALDVIPQS